MKVEQKGAPSAAGDASCTFTLLSHVLHSSVYFAKKKEKKGLFRVKESEKKECEFVFEG